MKSIKKLKVLSWVSFALAIGILLYLGINKNAINEIRFTFWLSLCTFLMLVFVFGIIGAWYLYYKLNIKPENDRCKKMAVELNERKRQWYLKEIADRYLAYPLSEEDITELGEDASNYAISTNDEVVWLLNRGEIENVRAVRLTITYRAMLKQSN